MSSIPRVAINGEAAEIFHLSYLGKGARVAASAGDELPVVQVDDPGFAIRWPAHQKHNDNTEYEVSKKT